MSRLVPPYGLIQERLFEGRVIPFLGAGASLGGRSSGTAWAKDLATYLPTAGELTSYLARKTEFPSDEPLDLAKVAQYYDVVGGRELLDQELHEIFNRDYSPSTLHTFLAEVPVPLLVVTSNYDDLIEQAFNAKGRTYHVVIHTTDPAMGYQLFWWPPGESQPREVIPNKLDINFEADTVIYKMHGAVDRQEPARDQYVITEDDYIDFLARMTKNKAIPSIFFRPFQTRHFLFLGYGLRDWNLRVVLNRIEKDLRRANAIKSWAIQYKPSPLEQRFWQQRGVEVYDMVIDEFISQLRKYGEQ
ncbi:MAG TPA: SIR2 family protein [Anaerolineales bacterium]|nr:SIR2 family protein [Anaerolineales bacterium]